LDAAGFNPCFAGFPFRTTEDVKKYVSLRRFNPCFAGFPFRTSGTKASPIFFAELFQSLFCWISVSDTANTINNAINNVMFQSLFCWISVSDVVFVRGCLLFPLVSILVLLDFRFGLYNYRRCIGFNGSFNPCFAGFPFRTSNMASCNSSIEAVSILVLLDFRFGHPIAATYHEGCTEVSILVLLDFRFGLV